MKISRMVWCAGSTTKPTHRRDIDSVIPRQILIFIITHSLVN